MLHESGGLVFSCTSLLSKMLAQFNCGQMHSHPQGNYNHGNAEEIINQADMILGKHTRDNGGPSFLHNNHSAYNGEILVVYAFDSDHNTPNQEDLENQ